MFFRYFFQWDNFIVRMVITCEAGAGVLALIVVLGVRGNPLQQWVPAFTVGYVGH